MGKVKDITGLTINEWTVLKEAGRNKSGGAMFLCRCSCGKEKIVEGRSIRSGTSTNCGHKRKEVRNERAIAAVTKHGGKKERLYSVWTGMKERCNNPNSKFYFRYGGRGIKICDEWNDSYATFREWALKNGYDPSLKKGECTIERIDNDKGYSPDNCIWASSKVQCNNRSSNHILELNGVSHTISEWSNITGIRKDTLRRRVCVYGWNVERALQTPVRPHRSLNI